MISNKTKEKAFKYYCMGLNSKEIAKLLDLNFRTVQQIMNREDWKLRRDPKGMKQRIIEQRKKGFSLNTIALNLGVSRSTVYKHLK